LALIRGLGEYPDSLLDRIPDRARRAPFRDDGGERSRKLNRTTAFNHEIVSMAKRRDGHSSELPIIFC